jgi:hypothetical protein
MWIFELIWEAVIYVIVDGIGALNPRESVWFWVILALIVCVIIGLCLYFAL